MARRARCGTALVLVGGRGTRLAPAVHDRAKVVADVGGRPFLTYLLDRLEAADVARVVLCTGYRGQEVRALIGDRYGALALEYSHEDEIAGTGGALRLAADRFDADPVLVLNGDSYCEVDLRELWARHQQRGPAATMVVAEVPDAGRFGRVEMDAEHAVRAFREKTGEPSPGWINAGIYVVGRAQLRAIDTGRAVSLESEVLPAWIAKGLDAFPTRGGFLDIGTPRSYAAAEEELRAMTSRSNASLRAYGVAS